MLKKIVIATSNLHKVEEINAIVKDFGVEFVLPPTGFNPVENGKSFEENALIKAKEANRLTGMASLADDSGLCVDALNGEPGIHSARYAGTQSEKIKKLLSALEGVEIENRTAKFVCAMVLINENGEVLFSEKGECFGKIGFEIKGSNGFGYDPVFVVEGYNLTMAEMDEDLKNKISHRGRAVEKFLDFINNR